MARWMLLLVLVLVGCSGQDPSLNGRPKVVVAMGTVLYKGAPLPDASVIFTNLESATTAYAQTDSAGNFKLTTFNKGDGAAPGKQAVSVRKLQMLDCIKLNFHTINIFRFFIFLSKDKSINCYFL